MRELNHPGALNPAQRQRHLDRMASEVFDLVVIGGGVTGAGTALDAVNRGLRVALVEQRDYASGTSSRSSKLFHGGLRYLEQLNFKLVAEALAERNLMLRTLCPHLVRPVPFLYPLVHRFWERPYVGAGVFLYDMMARRSDSPLPRHRHIRRGELADLAPALDPARVHGAVQYWDAQTDDARHTVTLARTAGFHGALLASSTRVLGFETVNDQVRAALAVDLESGTEIAIRAKAFVNATGVWTDDLEDLAGVEGLKVNASKGVHLVVPRDRIRSETGLILRTSVSVLFVIPWGDHWIVGTTDTPWSLGKAHPAASSSDIEYLLRWVNTVLADPLTRDDVVGVYAGLRPLLAGETDKTSRLSREHAVLDAGNGLISVAGGKYTTYRIMARDAVDAAAPYLDYPLPPSKTQHLPLLGAEGFSDDPGPPPPELEEGAYRRLLGRYGSMVSDLVALIREQPELAEPVVGDAPYLGAELVYGVTHEGALHLEDLLARRTRMSIETRHRGTEAAEPVARLVAGHLGWDTVSVQREIAHYLARVEAERDSQTQPDDRTADAARMGAPDVRTGKAE